MMRNVFLSKDTYACPYENALLGRDGRWVGCGIHLFVEARMPSMRILRRNKIGGTPSC